MVREHILYDFSSFKCIEIYFMAWDTANLVECPKGT